jgi:hypothetical protein
MRDLSVFGNEPLCGVLASDGHRTRKLVILTQRAAVWMGLRGTGANFPKKRAPIYIASWKQYYRQG